VTDQHKQLKLLPGERWWGGLSRDGGSMPYGDAPIERDFSTLFGNQGMPLLISNKGRCVWSDDPFTFSFTPVLLDLRASAGDAALEVGEGHENLRQAFRHLCQHHFPPQGGTPAPLLLTAPQYSTWIAFIYDQRQDRVLRYAEDALANGFPPGVIMIDDNWMVDYGTWRFRTDVFPDPKAMVARLNDLGFRVMMWTCPFVSPDSPTFRDLRAKSYLLKDKEGVVAVRRWWNGYSAILDLSNDDTLAWYRAQLEQLVAEYGVDGFKFDGGDTYSFRDDDQTAKPARPLDHSRAFARLGLHWRFNECRASWKCAGLPLAQRLSDKRHSWAEDGLAGLLPNGLAQGLLGYAFGCPDMIGGGENEDFEDPNLQLDAELFVRYAQCAALFPMMQFSLPPWEALDREHAGYCLEAARVHVELAPEIEALAQHAAETGEPIMRHLAYVFPEGGYEEITDQFLVGDDLLVAPVLQKGADKRTITFPPGTWNGDDGSTVEGPCVQEVAAPLSRLPRYRRS